MMTRTVEFKTIFYAMKLFVVRQEGHPAGKTPLH